MKTLAQVIDRIESIARPDFRQGIAKELGDEIVRQVGIGFETQSDPYGAAWKERKHQYPHPILDRNGELKRSYRITAIGPDFVRVASSSDVAQRFQFKTEFQRIRLMVPLATRGLGVWAARLKYLAEQSIKGALNG